MTKPSEATERLQAAFRELREAWFENHLKSHAHEREWESEDQATARHQQNVYLKRKFDQQTEGIICGELNCVAPYAPIDLD